MTGNAELLNFIYQNSQMGIITISQLLDMIDDMDFKVQLQAQLKEYRTFNKEVMQMLNKNGYDEKGIGAFDKLRTYLMINMQTLTNKTTSHIAEMLIIGSNMGIIDAIKNIRKYQEAEKDIVGLMNRLLEAEEKNVNLLKAFL